MSLKARVIRLEARRPAPPATAEGLIDLIARGAPTDHYMDRISEAEIDRARAMIEQELRRRGLQPPFATVVQYERCRS